MIPIWLLTILHYISLTAAFAVLMLLAWQGVRALRTRFARAEKSPD